MKNYAIWKRSNGKLTPIKHMTSEHLQKVVTKLITKSRRKELTLTTMERENYVHVMTKELLKRGEPKQERIDIPLTAPPQLRNCRCIEIPMTGRFTDEEIISGILASKPIRNNAEGRATAVKLISDSMFGQVPKIEIKNPWFKGPVFGVDFAEPFGDKSMYAMYGEGKWHGHDHDMNRFRYAVMGMRAGKTYIGKQLEDEFKKKQGIVEAKTLLTKLTPKDMLGSSVVPNCSNDCPADKHCDNSLAGGAKNTCKAVLESFILKEEQQLSKSVEQMKNTCYMRGHKVFQGELVYVEHVNPNFEGWYQKLRKTGSEERVYVGITTKQPRSYKYKDLEQPDRGIVATVTHIVKGDDNVCKFFRGMHRPHRAPIFDVIEIQPNVDEIKQRLHETELELKSTRMYKEKADKEAQALAEQKQLINRRLDNAQMCTTSTRAQYHCALTKVEEIKDELKRAQI